MFGLFSKKISIAESSFLDGFTDLHTHICPGIDDGMKTVEESLQTLAYYEQIGVKQVCLTPHVMEDMPKNSRESLSQTFNSFLSTYTGGLKIHLGAEYMLDNSFDKHLKEGLLTLTENYVLVETSYVHPPLGLENLLYTIHSNEYRIILAHPERYIYMDFSQYESLQEKNISFQLNLLSLTGVYGKGAKMKAEELLEKGFYKYVGTDIHKLSFHQNQFANKVFTKKQLERLLLLKENNNLLFSGK